MGTLNEPNRKVDRTVRLFDQFYSFDVTVPVNEFDAVNSYFMSLFKTKTAAQNFTTALFRISQDTGVPVLTLLQELQAQGQGSTISVTQTLAYYLNINRSRATLLGVGQYLTPNLFVARNVAP